MSKKQVEVWMEKQSKRRCESDFLNNLTNGADSLLVHYSFEFLYDFWPFGRVFERLKNKALLNASTLFQGHLLCSQCLYRS